MSEQTTNHEFRAETRKVLNILTHSLYSNREIFLRELISNASDALDKLRFLQSQTQHEAIRDADLPLEIRISSDKVQNCLTITDTGIGMTRDEMIENLGTIAHSGSEAFLKEHTQTAEDGTTSDASNIIGRFGIGFYSVFMVADKVEVTSLSATGDGPAYRWISDGTGTFTVEEAPDQADIKRGTTIRGLHQGRRQGVSGKIPHRRDHPHAFELYPLPHPRGRRTREHDAACGASPSSPSRRNSTTNFTSS